MRKLLTASFASALIFAACSSADTDGSSGDAAAPTDAPSPADAPSADDAMDHSAGDMDHDEGDGSVTVVDDKGLGMLKNGHHEEMTYTPLSPDDQAAVDRLLAVSREVAEQYPTLADWKAAGASQAGGFSPGLGIHYTRMSGNAFNPDGVMSDEDMLDPLVAIYDGTEDTAKIAGFMYYSASAEEPEGFPGDNDFWHYHTDICYLQVDDGRTVPISADGSLITAEECTERGGTNMSDTQWMVHVWSVPGYEVSDEDGGVFAEVNPKIDCPDGTYFVMRELEQVLAHPDNVCLSELET
jgi:hypothetical protein